MHGKREITEVDTRIFHRTLTTAPLSLITTRYMKDLDKHIENFNFMKLRNSLIAITKINSINLGDKIYSFN